MNKKTYLLIVVTMFSFFSCNPKNREDLVDASIFKLESNIIDESSENKTQREKTINYLVSRWGR